MENKGDFLRKEKMMKKVLVLTLVLGLAAVANATVTLSSSALDVPMGTSVTLTVSSDTASSYGGYIALTDLVAGAFGQMSILPGSGPDAAIEDEAIYPGYEGVWYFSAASFNPSDPIIAGDHFQIDYTAQDGSSLVAIQLWDFSEAVVQTINLQNTPEPMTLGLLGLGGLFLRRRK
jgi:hypothetical protein